VIALSRCLHASRALSVVGGRWSGAGYPHPRFSHPRGRRFAVILRLPQPRYESWMFAPIQSRGGGGRRTPRVLAGSGGGRRSRQARGGSFTALCSSRASAVQDDKQQPSPPANVVQASPPAPDGRPRPSVVSVNIPDPARATPPGEDPSASLRAGARRQQARMPALRSVSGPRLPGGRSKPPDFGKQRARIDEVVP
jgi:hypothetical protein